MQMPMSSIDQIESFLGGDLFAVSQSFPSVIC